MKSLACLEKLASELHLGRQACSLDEIATLCHDGGIQLGEHARLNVERLQGLLVGIFAELSLFWGGAMDAEAVALLARQVPRAYPCLLAEDVYLFVEMAMQGRFSKVYGTLCPARVMEWLVEYRALRAEVEARHYERMSKAIKEAHVALSADQLSEINRRIQDYLSKHQ